MKASKCGRDPTDNNNEKKKKKEKDKEKEQEKEKEHEKKNNRRNNNSNSNYKRNGIILRLKRARLLRTVSKLTAARFAE